MSEPRSEPQNLGQAAEAMRSGGRILIQGSATAADWGSVPGPVDTVLGTSGLSALLAYNPADMTVAVQAGMPLRQLQQHLAGHGQWIANDSVRVPAGATVGGLLATADAGPSQHRYGPLRDLVLGATLVLADGTIAHSGGHVIKNVAGYDLARLCSGSYGTLALLAEVVLRAHPRPPSSRTLTVPADAGTAHRTATELRDRPVDPTAVTWTGGRLLVRFTGTETGIVPQLDRAALPEAEVLDGAGEQAAWDADAALVSGVPGQTIFRVGALPSRFPELVDLVGKLAAGNGVTAEWSSALGVGIHTIALSRADAAAHAAVLTGVRTEFAGAAVTLHRRADGVDTLIHGWGPPPPSVGVLRAVKQAFDPDGRLGPNRFSPWLEGNTT